MHFITYTTLFLLTSITLNAHAAPLKIVTSIPPLNALAAGVAEGISEPHVLVPHGASHHQYALKPSDRTALQEADVVIWIGPSMEIFLQKPVNNLAKNTTLITVLDLPQLNRLPMREGVNWESHAHEDHGQSVIDPHVWLNPQNAIVITQQFANTFSQLDPQNASLYQANAKKRVDTINSLDKQLQAQLKPIQNNAFLVYHDAYQYFTKYYQLNNIGSISVSEELPPSAQRIYQLQQEIQKDKVMCIFSESGFTPASLTRLADQTHTRTATLDSMGYGGNFSDYIQLLQYNADTISHCLTNQESRQ